MQEFHYRGKTYIPSNSIKYNVSIQASLDGFSFLMKEAETGEVVSFSSYPFRLTGISGLIRKIKDLIIHSDLTERQFNKVIVFPESTHIRLIPSEFHVEKHIKSYFSVNPKLPKGYHLISSPVNATYQTVFGCHTELTDFFSSEFPGCLFLHETMPLVKKYQDNQFSEQLLIVQCHFHTGYFFVIIRKGNELLLFNMFSYSSAEDVLFYLVSSTAPFMGDSTVTELSGYIAKNDTVYSMLDTYFGDVCFPEFSYSGNMNIMEEGFQLHMAAPLLLSL